MAEVELLEVPSQLPCRYGVIGVRLIQAGPDSLEVTHVKERSPAQAAGLRSGDRLLAVLPYRIRTAAALTRYIQSLAPGTTTTLHIERNGHPHRLQCQIGNVGSLYFLMGEEQRPSPPPAIAPEPGPQIARLHLMLDSLKIGPALEGLTQALHMELQRYASDLRLSQVHTALASPLDATNIARELALEVQQGLWPSLIPLAARYLDHPVAPQQDNQLAPKLSPSPPVFQEHKSVSAFLNAYLGPVAQRRQEAFAALDSSQQAILLAGIAPLLKAFGKDFLLDQADSNTTQAHTQTLRLAKRVDTAALLEAAQSLSSLAAPAAQRHLRRLLRNVKAPTPPPGYQGRILYYEDSPWGPLLIGGKGPNVYTADAALIIDLGGDDIYLNNAGGTVLPAHDSAGAGLPVAIVIDLGGNDRYIANRPGSIGAGIGGIGMLVDFKGDDLYQGDILTQGTAFCGVGILADADGNDLYLAQEAAQGSAFFGLGLLADAKGTDLYSAAQFAQGFGGASGLGLLRDTAGHDRYQAGAKTRSTYGENGVYRGWSQGAACGFRGYTCGGLGILADAKGDDTYTAGNFSQGVGYFFGLGLLADAKGDDTYRAARYTQGSAAHQAVGILWEQQGDDSYHSTVAASQGAAWDAAIGFLVDDGGDDTYRAGHLSQGAAAMNGLAALIDQDGRDTYQCASGQAQGGSTAYWGGRNALNLGILWDRGGQTDSYSAPDRRDTAVIRFKGVGLFVDD
jgi:hypothetical protein